MMEDMIGVKELCRSLDCSRATLYRWMASDENFPQSYKMNNNINGKRLFKKSEIQDWLQKKVG